MKWGRHRVRNPLFDSFPLSSPSGVKARRRTEYLTGFEESARSKDQMRELDMRFENRSEMLYITLFLALLLGALNSILYFPSIL